MNRHLPASYALDQFWELSHLLVLDEFLRRGHVHVVRRELRRHAPQSALPDRSRVLRVVVEGKQRRVVAELDACLVLLETWRTDAHAYLCGDDPEQLRLLGDEIAARVPRQVEDRRVEVQFSDRDAGLRHVSIDVTPWEESRDHYAPSVQQALDQLVTHQPDPDSARRLLLWHGAPGTGKTSAVRTLTHAWRDWADTVVVTDPDALLADGKYLRRLVLDPIDDERWQVLVLEDAEALLRKATGGSAMGKLLNLADGLLGQGLRCLFLITTNEPLGAIHPAVVRPGRCLAQVEFGALPADAAARLLGRPVAGPMTLAEVMSAGPVRTVEEPVATGQYL